MSDENYYQLRHMLGQLQPVLSEEQNAELLAAFDGLDPKMPVKFPDANGQKVCKQLRPEFVDCEIFTKGLAFKQDGGWVRGSNMIVYGSMDSDQRQQFSDRVREIVDQEGLNPILIEFRRKEDGSVEGAKTLASIQIGAGEFQKLP